MNQASSIDIQRFSPLSFWKMHGCGNDFLVFEIKDPGITDGELSALAVRLCNRNFGVGADGIIVSVPSDNENLMMRIFNADGSFDPVELEKMYNLVEIEKYDLVFGSRYEKNAGSEDDTIITLIGNKIFSFFSQNISSKS